MGPLARLALMVAGVGLVGAVAFPVAGTSALWAASPAGIGAIATGEFDVAADPSELTWRETTSARPVADRRSGTGLESLASFVGASGDRVEVRVPLDVRATGDNMRAVVSLDAAGALPEGIAVAGFRLLDESLAPLAPATGLATASAPLPLPPGGTGRVIVAVTVEWTTSFAPTYVADPGAESPAGVLTIPLVIRVDQERPGGGS